MIDRKTSLQRVSTAQIKMGLQKIKLAQMQVLKQLRKQNNDYRSQNQYFNQRQNSFINTGGSNNTFKRQDNIQNLRRQLFRQRQKSAQNANTLYRKVNQLQSDITKKTSKEVQLKVRISQLEKQIQDRTRFAEQKINQNKKVNQISQNWQDQYNKLKISFQQQKIKNNRLKYQLQVQKDKYQKLLNQSHIVKKDYDQLKKRFDSDRRKKTESSAIAQVSPIDKKKIIHIQKIVTQLRKINQSHDKLYAKLKSLASVKGSDLDIQEQYQNAFNRTINLIESLQKNFGKKSDMEESAILSNIIGKYQFQGSFRQDIKKIEKQLFGNQQGKKQLTQLLYQNYNLKEQLKTLKQDNDSDKKFLQHRVVNLRAQLKQAKQKIFSLENNKLIDGSSVNNSKKQRGDIEAHQRVIQKLVDQKRKLQIQVLQLRKQFSSQKRKTNLLQRSKSDMIQIIQNQSYDQSQGSKQKMLKKQKNNNLELKYKASTQSQKKSINSILKEMQIYDDTHNQNNQQMRQKIKLIIQMSNQVRKQNNSLKKQIQKLQVDNEKLKLQRDRFQSIYNNDKNTITNLINQNARLREGLKKLQFERNQIHQKNLHLSHTMQIKERNFLVRDQNYQGHLQNRTNQLNNLRKENQNYFKQHRQLLNYKDQFSKLEAEFKTISRNSKQIDAAIDHLWDIKETEYQNINTLLKLINAKKKQVYQ